MLKETKNYKKELSFKVLMFEQMNNFFRPEKIYHRDNQLSELREVFERFKAGRSEKNILAHGSTGTGKTLCISKVLSEQENQYIYVPSPSTAHQVLKTITDMTYNTRERQRSEAIKILKSRRVVLIIDELNAMKRAEEIRWLLEDLKFIYREVPLPIILLTNKNLYEMQRTIPEDVKKTFFFNELEFSPYNAIELQDIFQEGIKHLNLNVPEGFIPKLSAKISNEFDGSVRSGLFVLRECLDASDFSEASIDKTLKKIQNTEFEDLVKRLNEQEKRFLSALIYLRDPSMPEVPLTALYEKIRSLLPQRISQIIFSLESEGIITRTTPSKDRRKKCIKFVREDVFIKTKKVIDEMNILPLI